MLPLEAAPPWSILKDLEGKSKVTTYIYVKLSLIEGQTSLLAVWAIVPLSHFTLISTSDSTKNGPCNRDKLSIGQS